VPGPRWACGSDGMSMAPTSDRHGYRSCKGPHICDSSCSALAGDEQVRLVEKLRIVCIPPLLSRLPLRVATQNWHSQNEMCDVRRYLLGSRSVTLLAFRGEAGGRWCTALKPRCWSCWRGTMCYQSTLLVRQVTHRRLASCFLLATRGGADLDQASLGLQGSPGL
jgi:hypothetical protein